MTGPGTAPSSRPRPGRGRKGDPMRPPRRSWTVAALFLAAVPAAGRPAGAQPAVADDAPKPVPDRVVEGDVDALRTFVEMLKANRGSVPESGRFRFHCTRTHTFRPPAGRPAKAPDVRGGTPLNGTMREVAAGVVAWDGPNRRWDYKFDFSSPDMPNGGERPVSPRRAYIRIANARQAISYSEKAGAVEVNPAGLYSVHDTLQVLPGEMWFSAGINMPRYWEELIAPDGELENITRISAARSGAELTITLGYSHAAAVEVVGDLRTGAVTSSTIRNDGAGGPIEYQSEADWVRTGDGFAYPARISRTQFGTGENRVESTLTVSDYEPNFKVPAGFYTLAGLDLPAGTPVRRYDGQKLVSSGPLGTVRPGNAAADLIERMARKNAAGGFADPPGAADGAGDGDDEPDGEDRP